MKESKTLAEREQNFTSFPISPLITVLQHQNITTSTQAEARHIKPVKAFVLR
jgi:hypothetical protein